MGRDKKPANLDTLRSLAEAEIERVADACDPLERVYLQLYAISDWFGWSEAERAVLVLAVLANTDPDWHFFPRRLPCGDAMSYCALFPM